MFQQSAHQLITSLHELAELKLYKSRVHRMQSCDGSFSQSLHPWSMLHTHTSAVSAVFTLLLRLHLDCNMAKLWAELGGKSGVRGHYGHVDTCLVVSLLKGPRLVLQVKNSVQVQLWLIQVP
jgi:hypothetical protein